MPSLTKRHYESAAAALQNLRTRVSLTKTWQELHDWLAIGSPQGRHLQLSPKDHQILREAVLQATGLDPLTQSSQLADRLAAASANAIDEKWGGAAGAAHLVSVSRIGQPIPTVNGDCMLPPGTALWLESSRLSLSPSMPVVIVENLAAFLHIDRLLLPAEWAGALFVYRGHDKLTTGTQQLLTGLPGKCRVAVLSDFDPAGLVIALSTPRAQGWLGPALDAPLDASNNALFEKQAHLLPGLVTRCPDGLTPLCDRLRKERIAFTQERMIAASTPLAFHSFGGEST